MPVETPGPDLYISDLNKAWPAGDETRSEGDDHLRNIKEALQNTFPGAGEAITRSFEDINRSAIPGGSNTVFWQATPPAGWTRVTGVSVPGALRLVTDGESGGGAGGYNDPFNMTGADVPRHTHGNSGSTSIAQGPGDSVWCSNGDAANIIRLAVGSNYTAYSQSRHTHAYGATTLFNNGPDSWRPYYVDVIMCVRDTNL